MDTDELIFNLNYVLTYKYNENIQLNNRSLLILLEKCSNHNVEYFFDNYIPTQNLFNLLIRECVDYRLIYYTFRKYSHVISYNEPINQYIPSISQLLERRNNFLTEYDYSVTKTLIEELSDLYDDFTS